MSGTWAGPQVLGLRPLCRSGSPLRTWSSLPVAAGRRETELGAKMGHDPGQWATRSRPGVRAWVTGNSLREQGTKTLSSAGQPQFPSGARGNALRGLSAHCSLLTDRGTAWKAPSAAWPTPPHRRYPPLRGQSRAAWPLGLCGEFTAPPAALEREEMGPVGLFAGS